MKTIPVSLLAASLFLPAVALSQPAGPPREAGGDRKGPFRQIAEAWKKADTDQDGMLSKAEFETLPRISNLPEDKRTHLFDRLDKNDDGKLGRDELESMIKARDGEGRMKRLWELDADKSGGISFAEFQAGPLFQKLPAEKQQKVFNHLDTDGDGMVTPKDKPEPFKRPDGKGRHGKPGEGGPDRGDGPPQFNPHLDADKDGAISFEEFRKSERIAKLGEDAQEDRFEELDRNDDLKLTPDDFRPPAAAPADNP